MSSSSSSSSGDGSSSSSSSSSSIVVVVVVVVVVVMVVRLRLLLMMMMWPLHFLTPTMMSSISRGRIYPVGAVDVKYEGARNSGIVKTFLYPVGTKVEKVDGVDPIQVEDIFALLRLSLKGM